MDRCHPGKTEDEHGTIRACTISHERDIISKAHRNGLVARRRRQPLEHRPVLPQQWSQHRTAPPLMLCPTVAAQIFGPSQEALVSPIEFSWKSRLHDVGIRNYYGINLRTPEYPGTCFLHARERSLASGHVARATWKRGWRTGLYR